MKFCISQGLHCLLIENQPSDKAIQFYFFFNLEGMTSDTAIYTMDHPHTGKCIRRLGGIYAYCWYLRDRKW